MIWTNQTTEHKSSLNEGRVSVVSDVTLHGMKSYISVEGFRRRSFVHWVLLCSCLMVLSKLQSLCKISRE
jgi:hypothetical protein